jgi:hypothetical protein
MELNTAMSHRVLSGVSEIEAEHPIYSGLEIALADFRTSLKPIPEKLSTVGLGKIEPKVMGTDKPAAISQLFHQSVEMLKFYTHILACNYASLVDGAAKGLNSAEYTQTFLNARAFVEHSAVAEVRLKEIENLCIRAMSLKPSQIRKFSSSKIQDEVVLTPILELIFYLGVCYGAGRFNREVLKDYREISEVDFSIELHKKDPHRQIGVMDAIDSVDWKGDLIPATNPRFYYEFLCDYVHPNVGANLIFVNEEEVLHCQMPGASERTFIVTRESARLPQSASMRLHIIQAIYIPFRESLALASAQLSALNKQIDEVSRLCDRLREVGLSPLLNTNHQRPQ